MPLEDDVALGAHHVGAELLPIIAIRARRIFPRIALRGALIVGDEDGARDAPVVRIGFRARFLFAGAVVRPVARQPVRQEQFAESGWKSRSPIAITPFECGATTVPTISGLGR